MTDNYIAKKLIALDYAARTAEKNGLGALTTEIEGHDVTAKAVWTRAGAYHSSLYRTYWKLDGHAIAYKNLRATLAQSIAETTA